jgi:Fur family peroxide stress response transcriptional regulator
MADDHPSVETIHNRLQQKLPMLSVDTVYRTLATFEKHEIITRVQTSESQGRFEAKMEKHHHVICKNAELSLILHGSPLITPKCLRRFQVG